MLLPLWLVKLSDSWRRFGCCCSSGCFRQDPPAWSSVRGRSWSEHCCRSQMRQCLGSGRTASGHCRWRSRSGPELTDHASNRSDSPTSCDWGRCWRTRVRWRGSWWGPESSCSCCILSLHWGPSHSPLPGCGSGSRCAGRLANLCEG